MYLEVITGPVGSGKSARLIDYTRDSTIAEKLILTGNPQHNAIESRNGQSVPALVLTEVLYCDVIAMIEPRTNIFIDEVQFVPKKVMEDFVKFCIFKCTQGWDLQLFVAGIDTTAKCFEYSTRNYPTMEWLLRHADEVVKLKRQCPKDKLTRYSLDVNPALDERDKARYESVCAECFFLKSKQCGK